MSDKVYDSINAKETFTFGEKALIISTKLSTFAKRIISP